ncbi:hypothetical protein HanRHA438_Chr01g0027001 [Helianthus annuus]|nr:hypothetical protein HanRHA438_Chr01g0027001 [Helianthus annuus]
MSISTKHTHTHNPSPYFFPSQISGHHRPPPASKKTTPTPSPPTLYILNRRQIFKVEADLVSRCTDRNPSPFKNRA